MADALAEILRQHRGVDQRSVQQFRIEIRHDAACADRLALLGDHAHRAAALHQHFPHRTRDANFHTAFGGGLGHRLGDRAHSADCVSPGALLAIDLAEHVVQQHVSGTRRVRTRIVADHAVKSVGRLDRRALEPGIEIVSRRFHEQIQQFAPHRQIQLGDAFGLTRAAQQFRQRCQPAARRDIRRSLQHQIAQDVGDDLQTLPIRRQAFGVAARRISQLPARYVRRPLSGSCSRPAAESLPACARPPANHVAAAPGRE